MFCRVSPRAVSGGGFLVLDILAALKPIMGGAGLICVIKDYFDLIAPHVGLVGITSVVLYGE